MWGNKSNKKYGYKQQQLQIQETAHEMELAIDTFHNTLEALEEYIGKADYYSDWESKRQIYRKSIKDSNDSLEGFEDLFLTQLLIIKATINKKPEFFRKEVQKEYQKWISATGIKVNNCPEKLKNYLFTVNEVLEGRGEDFVNQTKELIKDVKLTPQDSLKFFRELQEPLNKNDERGKSLEGKNWNQVESGKKLGSGDIDQGEEELSKIVRTSSNQINFYDSDYYQRPTGNPQQRTNYEIIQDVKDNPNNWRIDEIITEYNSLGGVSKKETALIHNYLAEVGFDGAVSNDQQPVYLIQRFSSEEKAEIEQILGISQSSSTVQTTRNLIEEIKRNIHEFEFQTVLTFNGHHYDSVKKRWVKHGDGEKSETMLVHKSVQMSEKDYDELGNLLVQQDKMFQEHRFSQEEWSEIKKALKNSEVIKRVEQNRNAWIIATVNSSSEVSYEALINKSAIEGRNLNISREFYNKELFTDEEWTKIGNIKNQQYSDRSQVFSALDSQPNQSNSSSIVITLAVISVLLVGGLKLVKKHLNNKGKE